MACGYVSPHNDECFFILVILFDKKKHFHDKKAILSTPCIAERATNNHGRQVWTGPSQFVFLPNFTIFIGKNCN